MRSKIADLYNEAPSVVRRILGQSERKKTSHRMASCRKPLWSGDTSDAVQFQIHDAGVCARDKAQRCKVKPKSSEYTVFINLNDLEELGSS